MERIHQRNYFYLFQLMCYRIYFLPPLQKSSIRVLFYPCYFPFTSGCHDSNSSQQSSRVPAFFIVELCVEVQIFFFQKDKYFSGFFTMHMFHWRLQMKTVGRLQLITLCISLLAYQCFKWIMFSCASQSLLSAYLRMQLKMVVFDLQNYYWIGPNRLNSKLCLDALVVKWSWWNKYWLFFFFFLSQVLLNQTMQKTPSVSPFGGNWKRGGMDAYLWILTHN